MLPENSGDIELACKRPARGKTGSRTGSIAGYRAHATAKEPPCQACKEAARVYSRTPRAQVVPVTPPPGKACTVPARGKTESRTGTEAGIHAHRRVGEPTCDECLASTHTFFPPAADPGMACAVPSRKSFGKIRTGTTAGYAAHKTAGEAPCEDCRGARSQSRNPGPRKRPGPKRREDSRPEGMACLEPSTRSKGLPRTGTEGGYNAHRQAGERPCMPCDTARRESKARSWERNKGGPKSPRGVPKPDVLPAYDPGIGACSTGTLFSDWKPRTGTPAGALAHQRIGERICDACQQGKKESDAAYVAENYERLKQGWGHYYQRTRDEQRAKNRQRYYENPENRRAASRAYHAANRDDPEYQRKHKARGRRWRAENPDKVVETSRRRRAKKRGVLSIAFTTEQKLQRYSMHGNVCWICGAEGPLTLDHVKPFDEYGPDILSNIRGACGSCNSRKRNRWEGPQWAQSLSYKHKLRLVATSDVAA